MLEALHTQPQHSDATGVQVSVWDTGAQKGTHPARSSRLTARSHRQIAGKWYVVALASNTEFFLREKGNMKMAMGRISFPGEDELEVSYAVPK